MLIFKEKIVNLDNKPVDLRIYLTAAERLKSQQRIEIPEAEAIYLRLPRGEILLDGDRLLAETGEIILEVMAKEETVMTVKGTNQLDLLKAAYHLGNRHVPLEIKSDYLRLARDPVLNSMLEQLGLTVTTEIAPFYPEMGAYSH